VLVHVAVQGLQLRGIAWRYSAVCADSAGRIGLIAGDVGGGVRMGMGYHIFITAGDSVYPHFGLFRRGVLLLGVGSTATAAVGEARAGIAQPMVMVVLVLVTVVVKFLTVTEVALRRTASN
jgi:hypothetical protein